MIGPISMPPTMTVASGRCTWLPMPVESAAGSKPMQADSVIIRIGAHLLLDGMEHRFDRVHDRSPATR